MATKTRAPKVGVWMRPGGAVWDHLFLGGPGSLSICGRFRRPTRRSESAHPVKCPTCRSERGAA